MASAYSSYGPGGGLSTRTSAPDDRAFGLLDALVNDRKADYEEARAAPKPKRGAQVRQALIGGPPQQAYQQAYQPPAPQVQERDPSIARRQAEADAQAKRDRAYVLPQSMMGAGAGPGFTPAMGVDWSMVPAYLRAQYENPIAQAALTRAQTFRAGMVPGNDPGGGGQRLAPAPQMPDERPAWWVPSRA